MGDGGIRFAVQMPYTTTFAEWLDVARRVEDDGFYAISVPDHFGSGLPQFAPLISLAAAASVTSTVRLTTTVLCNDFRHPVVLAKEIATLDQVSNGRLDVGLGAGWMQSEYAEAGISWDRGGERVDRLEESVRLVRRLLAGESVTWSGTHYSLDGHTSSPRPLQDPVPLLIACGARRILSFAAGEADIVAIIAANLTGDPSRPPADLRLPVVQEQLGWIRAAAGERRPVLNLRILLTELGPARDAAKRAGAARGMSADEVLASPFALVGSLGDVRDKLLRQRDELGLTYYTVFSDAAFALAPIVRELAEAP